MGRNTLSFLRSRCSTLWYHARRLRTYPLPIVIATSCLGFLVVLIIVTGCLYLALPLPVLEFRRIAIVVPFRDRFDELLQFVPHMHDFLTNERIRVDIFVVNQVDEYRFNRAALINVGFLAIKDTHGCMVMHDVDLLPSNPALSYACPAEGSVMHLAAPDLHPRYHYAKFIGGILLVGVSDFQRVNGMSNKYWGWGMEDDEFYVRLNQSKIEVRRPSGITTGYETFRHVHDARRRKRDTDRLPGQRESMRKRDRDGGLHSVAYDLKNKYELEINGSVCTVLNVALRCDLQITPWCLTSESSSTSRTT